MHHYHNKRMLSIEGLDWSSSHLESNEDDRPWSFTLPSSYPTFLHTYEQQEWEEELEKECMVIKNNKGRNSTIQNPTRECKLRKRAPSVRSLLQHLALSSGSLKKFRKLTNGYKRSQWTDKVLDVIMEAIDNGHPFSEVCAEYNVPRSSLKDHMSSIITSREMESKGILTNKEETRLCTYIEEMIDCRLPLIPIMVKIKVD